MGKPLLIIAINLFNRLNHVNSNLVAF